ncbi:hypothetical protein IAR55_002834 [Kwoniella newhampshirensis]|uniref:BRCT domain-containing protein n=1 Tax=Kwoniella newhampshirensis TaxID=1651941 RepID=A0AAW0YXT2_9TREE
MGSSHDRMSTEQSRPSRPKRTTRIEAAAKHSTRNTDLFASLGPVFFTPSTPKKTINLFVHHSGRLYSPPAPSSSRWSSSSGDTTSSSPSSSSSSSSLSSTPSTQGASNETSRQKTFPLPDLIFVKSGADPLVAALRTRPWVLYRHHWIRDCVREGKVLSLREHVVDDEVQPVAFFRGDQEEEGCREQRRMEDRVIQEKEGGEARHHQEEMRMIKGNTRTVERRGRFKAIGGKEESLSPPRPTTGPITTTPSANTIATTPADRHSTATSYRKSSCELQSRFENARLVLDTERPVILLPSSDVAGPNSAEYHVHRLSQNRDTTSFDLSALNAGEKRNHPEAETHTKTSNKRKSIEGSTRQVGCSRPSNLIKTSALHIPSYVRLDNQTRTSSAPSVPKKKDLTPIPTFLFDEVMRVIEEKNEELKESWIAED